MSNERFAPRPPEHHSKPAPVPETSSSSQATENAPANPYLPPPNALAYPVRPEPASKNSLWRTWLDLNLAILRFEPQRLLALVQFGRNSSRGAWIAGITIALESVFASGLCGLAVLVDLGVDVPEAYVMLLAFLFALVFIYHVLFWCVVTGVLMASSWLARQWKATSQVAGAALLIQRLVVLLLFMTVAAGLGSSLLSKAQLGVPVGLLLTPFLVLISAFPLSLIVALIIKLQRSVLGITLSLVFLSPLAFLALAPFQFMQDSEWYFRALLSHL